MNSKHSQLSGERTIIQFLFSGKEGHSNFCLEVLKTMQGKVFDEVKPKHASQWHVTPQTAPVRQR
jgi:hypothetical protein